MGNQGTLPYQKHSETSRMAAEQCSTVESLSALIWEEFKKVGHYGLIADEIAVKYKIQAGTVAARFRGLEQEGAIVKTTNKRKTSRDRWAHVYVTVHIFNEGIFTAAPTKENSDTKEKMAALIDFVRFARDHYRMGPAYENDLRNRARDQLRLIEGK